MHMPLLKQVVISKHLLPNHLLTHKMLLMGLLLHDHGLCWVVCIHVCYMPHMCGLNELLHSCPIVLSLNYLCLISKHLHLCSSIFSTWLFKFCNLQFNKSNFTFLRSQWVRNVIIIREL
jgi:hypothetical protein